MTILPRKHVVVVDGSNLATEGRTTPSLLQLDEAVRAYAIEDPDAEIVVVVDASFEHRVDSSEREQLIDAELHGEVVSPPAGAIGRGDAFVLRIAERTGARVLSNDSFQEFHAEHPWLFDKGRLVGGKPVPGIGWIFTPRIPVRGPKSRQAAGKHKREEAQALSPPAKAAELAKAAKKIAARKVAALPDGSKPSVGDVWPAGERSVAAEPARQAADKKAKKGEAQSSPEDASKKKAKKKQGTDEAVAARGAAEAPPAQRTTAKRAAPVLAPKKEAPKKEAPKKEAPKKEAPKKEGQKKEAPERETPAKSKKVAATKEAPAKSKKVAATKEPQKIAGATAKSSKKGLGAPVTANGAAMAKAARSTASRNPAVQEAIGQALAEVIAPVAEPGEDGRGRRGQNREKESKGGRHRRRRSPTPPPAVNEPLAFITFVATYPLDSELEGEVVSFTSHGAMVDVDLPGGGVLHSYIPLTAMGDPPPAKARQVLTRGERRRFALVALDPPRRVAELALPEVVAAHAGALV